MDDHTLRSSANEKQNKPIILKGNSTPARLEKVLRISFSRELKARETIF